MTTPQSIHPFDPNFFFDGIRNGNDSDKRLSLFKRFFYIQQQFKNAINSLTAAEPSMREKKNPATKIRWTFTNIERPNPGPTLQKDILAANSVFRHYADFRYKMSAQNKLITDADFEAAGLGEDMYLWTLARVAPYIAWAFGCVVPNDIVELYASAPPLSPIITDLNIDALALNPKPRTLVLFVIDDSAYMTEDNSLETLEAGFAELTEELGRDEGVASQLEIYIATAGGGAHQLLDFNTFERQRIQLDSRVRLFGGRGRCKMAAAITMALDRLEQRRREISEKYVDLRNCPWLIVLTNGRFADDMNATCQRLQALINDHKLLVYWRAMSANADMERLGLMPAQDSGLPQRLTSVRGFFKDISNSVRAASKSVSGGREELLNQRGYTE